MTTSRLGLGLDAGGTTTRWALANAEGEVTAHGETEGLSALLLASPGGTERIRRAAAAIAAAVLPIGAPTRVMAGLTGFSGGADQLPLRDLLASPLGIDPSAVHLRGDVEIAYLDAFRPGEGYLIYAGTGSMGIHIDRDGTVFRVGGHGGILDDAGSGFWIAIAALRAIWRAEDEQPGASATSPLARALFDLVGGDDWSATRRYVYGAPFEENRGAIGRLAVAVGKVADVDPVARALLAQAGAELGRLARVFINRFGPKPVRLAGRVVELHASIQARVEAALPEGTPFEVGLADAHVAAARLAAKG